MGDIVINKQGLIFLTLTSLILVLSVYYVTMPNELLLTTNNSYVGKEEATLKEEKKETKEKVVVENTSTIQAMKSILNDERIGKVKDLNNKLTNKELSFEEKNNIYEELKNINKVSGMEEDIESIIKKEYNLDSFVKVNGDIIEVTIASDKHDTTLAAKIMTSIEKKYDNMYISVSFKK